MLSPAAEREAELSLKEPFGTASSKAGCEGQFIEGTGVSGIFDEGFGEGPESRVPRFGEVQRGDSAGGEAIEGDLEEALLGVTGGVAETELAGCQKEFAEEWVHVDDAAERGQFGGEGIEEEDAQAVGVRRGHAMTDVRKDPHGALRRHDPAPLFHPDAQDAFGYIEQLSATVGMPRYGSSRMMLGEDKGRMRYGIWIDWVHEALVLPRIWRRIKRGIKP